MADLKVRNVICDYYFSSINNFNICKYGRGFSYQNKLNYPTLRVFGIHETGEKCCIHIHGYLPYVIIRTGTRLTENLNNHITNLIEECFRQSNLKNFQLNYTSKNKSNEIIYGIYEEKGRSIYGYCESSIIFLKIYFYNPVDAKIFGAFLQKECAQCEWLQPFNIHIPFTLQFFIDFSLHGMNYVHLRHFYSRKMATQWPNKSPLQAVSRCSIEIDAFTDNIMNPLLSKQRDFESVGLAFIWQEEQKRCELMKMPIPKVPSAELENAEITNDMFSSKKCQKEFEDVLGRLREIELDDAPSNPILQTQQIQERNNTSNELMGLAQNSTRLYEELQQTDINDDCCNISLSRSERIWENQEYRSLGFEIEDNEEDNTQDGDDFVAPNKEISIDSSESEATQQFRMGMQEGEGDDCERTFSSIQEFEKFQKTNNKNHNKRDKYKNVVRICPTQDGSTLDKRDKSDEGAIQSSLMNINVMEEKHFENRSSQQLRTSLTESGPSYFQNPFIQTPRTPFCMETGVDDSFQCNQQNIFQDINSNVDHLCALSMEIVTFPSISSNRIIANPQNDQIYAITFSYHNDICNWRPSNDGDNNAGLETTVILIRDFWRKELHLLKRINKIIMVHNEIDLFTETAKFLLNLDPELLIGYDAKRFSWGYLFERAQFLKIPLKTKISRVKELASECNNDSTASSSLLIGRLILQVWWLVRKERPLHSYNFGNVVKEILNMKFSELDGIYLAQLFASDEIGLRSTLLKYFLRKSFINLHLLAHLDLFVRTCQMAQVYGIQFEGVLTRGSQFRVESMLLRLAIQRKLFAPSVNIDQRAKMHSPETIPLNIEPKAGLHKDPVIILDFQSLYPSISIAYNYCFSTCLGKICNYEKILDPSISPRANLTQKWINLGALPYAICSIDRLEELLKADKLIYAPNGAVFVKKCVSKGLLPILLSELLETRVMVKNSMKKYKKNQKLTRLLDARQLALKLIANVTYGYTAANWSGRMPCEDVADAIVSKGRETVERTIDEINNAPSHKYKGAKVIYGDTDSVFIICKGCTREEAFLIGRQISDNITAQNPYPIKLKFEKVMHPCFIVAKKRYMGISFESIEDAGIFSAKGIETIRRDSPSFVVKVMERFLKILFESSLISALYYLQNRLSRLKEADCDLDEFFLSIDYNDEYAESSKSVANKLGRELTELSKRLTPQYGERLLYVVTIPCTKTYDDLESEDTFLANSISVDKFLRDPTIHLDFDYYVEHQLFPALQRILNHTSTKLTWNTLTPEDQCTECRGSDGSPWCDDCMRYRTTFRKLFARRIAIDNCLEKFKRICNECIGPMKSVDIEGFTQCSNYSCPVKRRAAAFEKDAIITRNLHIFADYNIYH